MNVTNFGVIAFVQKINFYAFFQVWLLNFNITFKKFFKSLLDDFTHLIKSLEPCKLP